MDGAVQYGTVHSTHGARTPASLGNRELTECSDQPWFAMPAPRRGMGPETRYLTCQSRTQRNAGCGGTWLVRPLVIPLCLACHWPATLRYAVGTPSQAGLYRSCGCRWVIQAQTPTSGFKWTTAVVFFAGFEASNTHESTFLCARTASIPVRCTCGSHPDGCCSLSGSFLGPLDSTGVLSARHPRGILAWIAGDGIESIKIPGIRLPRPRTVPNLIHTFSCVHQIPVFRRVCH